jgi:hypothetical protein
MMTLTPTVAIFKMRWRYERHSIASADEGIRLQIAANRSKLSVAPTPPPELLACVKQCKAGLITQIYSDLDYWLSQVRQAQSNDELFKALHEFRKRTWTAQQTAMALVEVLQWCLRQSGAEVDTEEITGAVSRLPIDIQTHWRAVVRQKCQPAVVQSLELDNTRPDAAIAAEIFAGSGARVFIEGSVIRYG